MGSNIVFLFFILICCTIFVQKCDSKGKKKVRHQINNTTEPVLADDHINNITETGKNSFQCYVCDTHFQGADCNGIGSGLHDMLKVCNEQQPMCISYFYNREPGSSTPSVSGRACTGKCDPLKDASCYIPPVGETYCVRHRISKARNGVDNSTLNYCSCTGNACNGLSWMEGIALKPDKEIQTA